MKTLVFLLITLISVSMQGFSAEAPHFYIECEPNGDTAQKYAGSFERVMAYWLTRDFPCVRTTTSGDVRTKLGREKLKQLRGSNEEMASFCEDLPHDYWIRLVLIDYTEGRIMVRATCFNYKKIECIADAGHIRTDNDYASLKEAVNKMSQMLVDMLKEYEICPYYGPLNIEVVSSRDETETFRVNAPCGQDIATVTATQKVNMNLKWELNKYGMHNGDGTVAYDLYENYTTLTDMPCYKCKNGDQGPVRITEIKETEAKAGGLSSRSRFDGKAVKDVHIRIVFFENGTYSLLVKATSDEGTQTDSKEKKVEGMCESESEPKDSKNRRIDVPIQVTLGPYQGTAGDKVLQQKETKDLSQGTEKTTLTVDFTLNRKD